MAEKRAIYEKLMNIQSELKASKSKHNDYGNYFYRSCEDILESVKPLLQKYGFVLQMSDELVLIGERYYIKANAILIDVENGDSVVNSAYAREPLEKKGADASQITGTSSSYARKYALNGLFCIDDTKDSDATNTGEATETNEKPKGRKATANQIAKINELIKDKASMLKYYGIEKVEDLTMEQASNIIKQKGK